MSTVFVKSYIEFLFNIKNNSIYISENRERLFVFKTSLEVLDTQLHRVIEMGSLHEGGLCLSLHYPQNARKDTTHKRPSCNKDPSQFRIHIINYNT